MIFSNSVFFVFFFVVFIGYLATRRSLVLQNGLILASSYVFYGWWDPRFLILIAISTVTDFLCGLAIGGKVINKREMVICSGFLLGLTAILALMVVDQIELIVIASLATMALLLIVRVWATKLSDLSAKKLYLTVSIIANLSLLGVFKYYNFFAESFSDAVSLFGWQPDFVTLNIILPVGISFYTFQTMSYSIDIYRRQLQPTTNFIQFAAFVSFFPQLVAGPIERARNLLPQFSVERVISKDNIARGAILFLWGFYKKTVVADNLAVISDKVFADPGSADPAYVIAGVLAFTFQIYCDFSGYSDMARGTARILGFNLKLNFNMPYFARTPSEFWQRWHISLSSWLRDYLYIPLGGNKKGVTKTYRNLMATMLIGGLWHGASWTFVAWGFLHGAILVIYRLLRVDDKLAATSPTKLHGFFIHALSVVVMFILVMIGWVFFRATSFDDAFIILSKLPFAQATEDLLLVLYYIGPLVAIECFNRFTGRMQAWEKSGLFVRGNLILFLLYSSIFLAALQEQSFIYFDF